MGPAGPPSMDSPRQAVPTAPHLVYVGSDVLKTLLLSAQIGTSISGDRHSLEDGVGP